MSRRSRLVLPGMPFHVIQRGVNRARIFIDDEDRQHYRNLLRVACAENCVDIHAFVLMDNHVHLLLTPARAESLAKAMRFIGQGFVRKFNPRHGRCGTLWQGRFKSCLVQDETYLLTVLRYIELNPVRAGMVLRAEAYRWSSARVNLGIAADSMITPHPVFLALGATRQARAAAYRDCLLAGVGDQELEAIRRHASQERVLGDEGFQGMVEDALGKPAACRRRGRPRRTCY